MRNVESREKLTIPKSFANLLDAISDESKKDKKEQNKTYSILDDMEYLEEIYYETSMEVIKPEFFVFYDFVKNNINLCVAYLTSKALDMDFVKVVADECESQTGK